MSAIFSPFQVTLLHLISHPDCLSLIVHLHFTGQCSCMCLILVTKADAVVKGTTSAACLYHQCNQSTHVTDGVTVTSLSATLQRKTRATKDRVWQIVLNQKLSHVVHVRLP
jgi:hypothetical protein